MNSIQDRLETFQSLLEKWQQKINLVSSKTLPFLWRRHFEDSLQLLPYLPPQGGSLIDLGSGAGFPGLVLALACPKKLDVTLVEADLRKCLFLENVSRETKINVVVVRSRIEALAGPISYDVVTARGLAPLPDLLKYAFPFLKEKSFCLFLKGKEAEKEIQEAQKTWEFKLEIFPSLTDSEGRILKIEHLNKSVPHV